MTENDVERLLKILPYDLGMFVLAVNSLVEKTLREKYNKVNVDEENFSILFGNYIDDFILHNPNDFKMKNLLKGMFRSHNFSNEVRHMFANLSEDEAATTIASFVQFTKAERCENYPSVKKLEKNLESWNNKEPFFGKGEELQAAMKRIEELSNKNKDLSSKANEYEQLQKQYEVLIAQENFVQKQLESTSDKLAQKDAKVNDLRQKNFQTQSDLQNQKKQLQEQIEKFKETEQYISDVKRLSSYTRTRMDYEQSIIRLTNEQESIIDSINLNKDYLIKGAAGTGKSLVLIKALEKAVEDSNGQLFNQENQIQFRLLTYTRSLVQYNKYVTSLLKTKVPDNSVTTADSYLFMLLKHYYPEKQIEYSFRNFDKTIFEGSSLSAEDMYKEAEDFIWANFISKKEYLEENIQRTGMNVPLNNSQRTEVWNVIEKAETVLQELNVWPNMFAAVMIKRAIENDKDKTFKTEYSFIDEAQDLSPVILAIIKETTSNAVFLAGDSDQSIYRKGFTWKRSGIDVSGRTKILHTNFRNTIQIHDFAEKYRNNFKDKDSETLPKAFRPGPPVEFTLRESSQALYKEVIEQVKFCINILSYEPENICIIAPRNDSLDKISIMLTDELNQESQKIGAADFSFETSKGVRLTTLQSCKGLDFPVVLLIADHRARFDSSYDEETIDTQQHNLIYVAMTRAMEMLHIFSLEEPTASAIIDLLKVRNS